MKAEKQGRPSREHEQVYHAVSYCQAASLSLTARRLHGLVKACSIEGKKTGSFASQNIGPLSGFDGVERPSRLKDSRNIGRMCAQHGENDPHPHVRQSTDCDTMTFIHAGCYPHLLKALSLPSDYEYSDHCVNVSVKSANTPTQSHASIRNTARGLSGLKTFSLTRYAYL